ncbi:MAG: hypothetical protein ACOCP4_05420 [Candidatus Woesearchaeota archaeon]
MNKYIETCRKTDTLKEKISSLKNKLEIKIDKNFIDMDDEELNISVSKMGHKEYLNFLIGLLENLDNNFDRVNYIFQNYFYLFKMNDLKSMKLIFSKYLDILLFREKNLKNREILLKWKNIINNPYYYSYDELNSINIYKLKNLYSPEFPDNVFNVKRILSEILKDSYQIIRLSPKKIDEICFLIDDLYNYFISNDYNSVFYTKLLSLSSLKNDVTLQKELREEQVDLYVNETLYLYNNNLCFGDSEGLMKVLENIAKAQFAYNLLGTKKNLIKEYRFIHKKLNEIYYFNKSYNNKEEEDFHFLDEKILISNTNLQYVFFVGIDNDKTIELHREIINVWAQHKNRYLYNSSKNRKINIEKYNFIY